MNDASKKIQVIIPTIPKDYIRMRHIQPERVLRYLPVSELIFIGNSELCDIVNEDISGVYEGMCVKAIHEDELVVREPVINYIKDRISGMDDDIRSRVRPGWYYQQFLKMAFCDICEGEYYMSWDMDTVPLRPIALFDEKSRPVFGLKTEYNPGYFKTIDNLLHIPKKVEGSFVSEHMVFARKYMKELTDAIDSSSLRGGDTWEKIISAVDDDYIALGFSEFETYGTFVTGKYPDAYDYRTFESFRRGSWFVKESDVTEEDLKWFATDYDAITFENAETIDDMVSLFNNPKYRNNMSARKFYETILESGYFGEYADGRLNAGDWFAPI